MTIAKTQLTNAKVSLFYDPAFIETGASGEGPNVKESLEDAGHIVTTFTGTSTNAWRDATQGVDVLVIPELEIAPLILSSGSAFFLKKFVSDGGTLIVHARHGQPDQPNTDLIDALFGTALNEVQSLANDPSTPTGEVTGTTYAGAALSLPWNDDLEALEAGSLPVTAKSLYQNTAGDSTVAAFQYGKGQIVWLGWDWHNAAPPPGTQDGGWNDILHRSVSHTDFEPNGLIINGTKFNDKVNFDPSAKTFDSSNRDDVMALKKGNDKAFGGEGHDVINGDKGKDKLHGGSADDILNGGKDKDKLWGDAGGDYFLFDQTGGTHADQIKDFVDGEDIILLKQSKFDDLTLGDMSALQFSSLIEYTSNGWLKYDGQKFAKLQSGGLDIGEEDFLIV
jgi:Ca2+-binding RTX toxin-like protein